ncbi:MAG: hypothetical protein WDO14_24275 [Bacteroidota bacterium]
MDLNIEADEASREREKQRSDSEARDIIHDVNKLYIIPEDKRSRWIWELLQNARDVAPKGGVKIHIKLTPTRFEFQHNGVPFLTKNLLALLYKTSTKSLGGDDGTTGKYGTGFVMTHLLNKKVTVSGVHENEFGKRRFQLEIDRSSTLLEENAALEATKNSLQFTFSSISDIARRPNEAIADEYHCFSYELNATTYPVALKGIEELTRNLSFVLLINQSTISSVTIQNGESLRQYALREEPTAMPGIMFASVSDDAGLIYSIHEKVIIGIPAVNKPVIKIGPLNKQAVLFKEFPLMGTEGFNLPVFVQHTGFQPTDQRDGIRTKKTSESDTDPLADSNRFALTEFLNSYLTFIETLTSNSVAGSYLLAKSGLPEFVNDYSNREWYEPTIQEKIREAVLKISIVTTVSGPPKKIADVKFIVRDETFAKDLYELASEFLPEIVADEDSVWHWSEIITQEPERWPEKIILSPEELVTLVQPNLDLTKQTSFEWLKKLYSFLNDNNLNHLGEKYPIYPNENNIFKKRDEVVLYPAIDDEFKIVSKGLSQDLDDKFLSRKVGAATGVKTFDPEDFYKKLNNDLIGQLKTQQATDTQARAIFHVCCLFRSDRAPKRDLWFSIINELLPSYAPEKKSVHVEYDNYGRSAEQWSMKFICDRIEETKKPTLFAEKYFNGNMAVCLQWLQKFIDYVLDLQDDIKDSIVKRTFVPVQSDEFKSYDDQIFVQDGSSYFDDTIKNIFRDYTKAGDPRKFLIDPTIKVEAGKVSTVELLTREIDKIFRNPNINDLVKKGGQLNEMFFQLNEWFEKVSVASGLLLTFAASRPTLYILALGEGFASQILEITKAGKSIEDIAVLAKLKLTTEQIQSIESAADVVGADTILKKAQELVADHQEKERWRAIGRAAEIAFREALAEIEPAFEIENPDRGKDFVIIANKKPYAIEIKSVNHLKPYVSMSILQGQHAAREFEHYALCVVTRNDDNMPMDSVYFKEHAKFVTNIGVHIGNSIEQWYNGINALDTRKDVKVQIDSLKDSVYVNRSTWDPGISFEEFVAVLREYFAKKKQITVP